MEYTIYRPNKKQTGGAMGFNLHKDRKFSFVKAAPQIAPMGEKPLFGWMEESINLKLELVDVGQILAVFAGTEDEANLFHKTSDTENKVFNIKHVPEKRGYSVKLSQKRGGEVKSVSIGIAYGEAQIFEEYLRMVTRENLKAAGQQ